MSTPDEIKLVDSAVAALSGRVPSYQLYRDYYNGKHRLAFATEKFRAAFGSEFSAFADNLCPAIVDALADRLQITEFIVEQGPESIADDVRRIWRHSRMDRKSGEVHMAALRDGDSYVIVDEDPRYPGRAKIFPNRADSVTVMYDDDDPDFIVLAVKRWTQNDGRIRVNVYYPDRTELYISTGSNAPRSLAQFDVFDDDIPNRFGIIPVFHFANNAPIGMFGMSELRPAIPLQDVLNKAILDMVVAMEYHALPQRWATGMEIPINPDTGVPDAGVAMQVNRAMLNRLMATATPEARFGQFEQADLTQFLQVQNEFRLAMARDTGTPLHYILSGSDGNASGESLKTREARFVKKVTDRQIAYGNVWEDVVRYAMMIEGIGSRDLQLSAQWTDPAPTSQRAQAEIFELLRRAPDLPLPLALKIAGYSQALIDEVGAAAVQQVQVLQERQRLAFADVIPEMAQ